MINRNQLNKSFISSAFRDKHEPNKLLKFQSMKSIISLVLILFTSLISYGQKLSLTDLQSISNKKKWESINQNLMNKGWEYYDSRKGSSVKYNTITWSYKKSTSKIHSYGEEDIAQAWLYLYTYEGFPSKVKYLVFNKSSYNIIQKSLTSNGYKLLNSEIEDNELISSYSNQKFILKITTKKREQEYETSQTVYEFLLIKKASIYDSDNGVKTDYYYDDIKKSEYTLKNGEMNGELKVFHYNGIIKKKGNYSEGKANGRFTEYDNNGNIEAEYTMINGKLNGVLKIYKAGDIDILVTYKNDTKNGQYIEYIYNNETGELQFKTVGEYIDGEKNGTWKLSLIDNQNTERLLEYENFNNGIKNGNFQKVSDDSLFLGSYKNNLLHGEYRIYFDILKMLGGSSVINTDTNKLVLLTKGKYFNGIKSGYWKNYDISSTLRNEGEYSNGEVNGLWKHYYSTYGDGNGGELPYSKQLYLAQNYKNGKLDGKSTRYSYLEKENYPCSDVIKEKNNKDTCLRLNFQKVFETTYYKNGKLNGPIEIRDSLNEIITKGNFKNNLKEGRWIQRHAQKDTNNNVFFLFNEGEYINGLKEGVWKKYSHEDKILETFNYKKDELHGEYFRWNEFGKLREKKQFSFGNLISLITYDSLGLEPLEKYEIFEETKNYYKCKRTEYFENSLKSQEYRVEKKDEINHNFFKLMFHFAIDKDIPFGDNGFKDGKYYLLNSKKQPLVTGKYYKERRIGLWRYFYYEQDVKIEYNFIEDKMNDEKYFDLNGGLYSGIFIYKDE